MKKLVLIVFLLTTALSSTARTIIVYYSSTNNSHTIAQELKKQTGADIIRVEPAEDNVDYNDYSIGLTMMNRIKNNPNYPASYPAIKTPLPENIDEYDTALVVAPLWWNAMAAPLQTFFFQYGDCFTNKNIGLIVSSGESPIEGVVADTKRLIPDGKLLEPALWIIRDKTDQCPSMISQWLKEIRYNEIASIDLITSYDCDVIRYNSDLGQIEITKPFESAQLYSANNGILVNNVKASPMDVSSQTKGLYVLRINNSGKPVVRKLLIR